MKILKNLNNFLSINKKKNLVSSLLKNVPGLNFKGIKKIKLLNGSDTIERVENFNIDNFNMIKNQCEFFYNLEENKIFNNVLKKKKIKNYSGMRHLLGLPVRGQRTHTNAKTPRKNIKKEI